MKRALLVLPLIAIAAGFFVMAGDQAHAGTTSSSDSVSPTATDWGDTVTIDKFDPALGVLTGITFNLTGSIQGSSAAENTSGTASAGATLNLTAQISLATQDAGIGTLTVTPTNSTGTGPLAAFDGSIDFGGTSGVTFDGLSENESTSASTSAPATLALFTAGAPNETIDLTVDALGLSNASGGGNLIVQFVTDAGADVEVVYEFDEPAISIEKTPDVQTILSGGQAAFTITVENTGDTELTNVTVTDALAPNCDQLIGILGIGESASYNCTLDNVVSSFTNTAIVTGDGPNQSQVTDQDDADVNVAGISIDKTPDNQAVLSGGTALFDILVTNTGDVDLVNVAVTDALAPDCDEVIGDLGISASFGFQCSQANVTDGFTNVAVVTGEDAAQNQVSDQDDAVVDILDITIDKSPDNQVIPSGGQALFDILVTNTGDVDLINVAVTDALAPDCDETIGALASGASFAYQCSADNVIAGFTNVAVVNGEDASQNQVSDQDDADVSILVDPCVGGGVEPGGQSVPGGEQVPSGACVGGGEPPIIECKWELPDINSDLAGIQYGDDDDPIQEPGFPCDRGDGPTDRPVMDDNVQNVIQVLPNAEDDPEARRIENWVAVEHPNGVDLIDDVFWKVFHADGTFKVQIHGDKVELNELDALGATNQPGTMWGAAWETGQVSSDAVHAVDFGIIDLVRQRQKDLYYADWQIHKEQMCGLYTVEVTAVADGATATMTNTIDIRCFFNLEIDFETVDWGPITPGTGKVLNGDTNFGTSGFPTVKNTGNSGMQVGIEFDQLVQQTNGEGTPIAGGKIIDVFDAAFGKSAGVLEWIDPIPANTPTWFNNSSINQVLCSNDVGKLDLSVHPPDQVPGGSYSGNVTVYARWAPGVCPNDLKNPNDPGVLPNNGDPIVP